MRRRPVVSWIAGALCVAAAFYVHWLERRRPLRRSVEPKFPREARNLSVAAVSAVALILVERPIVQPLAARVEKQNWGIVRRLGLPTWMEVTAALLLMDYAFYWWHVLMHRVPFLWRMHMVHHADLDMDTSTALRFHFTEMLASIPWRAGQVVFIGLTPFTFTVWQGAFLASILFHHSNLELPIGWERRLNKLIVTPRMHGIHHSVLERETNSNWSSGLTLWDHVHGTLRLNVPQSAVTIGVPAFQDPEQVTLPRILAMPFKQQPQSWELPAGDVPEPHREDALRTVLLP